MDKEGDVELGASIGAATAARARAHGEGERPIPDASAISEAVNFKAAEVPEVENDGKIQAGPTRAQAMCYVAGHALSAASLVVINKWALKVFPYLWTLTTAQFLFSALFAFLCGQFGLAKVDSLDWKRFISFFPAAGMFFITITAGNAVVQMSNVDTFIVMRSSVPIPTCLLESFALKEPYPPPRSWLGLAIIMIGAGGFAMSNRGLFVSSLSWVILYMVMMPVDGVLIKHLIGSMGFTPWGMVYYNNLCAALPGIFFSLALELNSVEAWSEMLSALSQPGAGFPIFLSMIMGVSVSFFQLNVRKAISSTAFTVLGVSNKFLTVLLNQFTMATTHDTTSICSVCLAIVGAVLFQQTVKGNGLSQAPPPKPQKAPTADKKAFGAMLFALCWCAYITINQPKRKPH